MNTPFYVGLAFAIFSAYLLAQAVKNYRRASGSGYWPTTTATLTEVQLWGRRLVDGEMLEAEHLRVAYRYEVHGQPYCGNRVAFYTQVYPETYQYAQQYPEGSEVPVYYDPAHPAEAVLIPGVSAQKPYSELILGSLGLLVGLAVALMGWFGLITPN